MYNAPQIDFLGMFLAAQNARAQREQMNMARERQDMEMQQFREQKANQAQLLDARKGYLSGDQESSKLYKLMAPDEYFKFEQQKQGAAEQRDIASANAQKFIASAPEEQRANLFQNYQKGVESGIFNPVQYDPGTPEQPGMPMGDLAGPPNPNIPAQPGNMGQIESAANMRLAAAGKLPGPADLPEWRAMYEFAQKQRVDAGQKPQTIDEWDAERAQNRRPVTNINNQMPGALTERTKGMAQSENLAAGKVKAQIDRMRQKYGDFDQYFTMRSKLEDYVAQGGKFIGANVPEEIKKGYNEQKAFESDLKQLKNMASIRDEAGNSIPIFGSDLDNIGTSAVLDTLYEQADQTLNLNNEALGAGARGPKAQPTNKQVGPPPSPEQIKADMKAKMMKAQQGAK